MSLPSPIEIEYCTVRIFHTDRSLRFKFSTSVVDAHLFTNEEKIVNKLRTHSKRKTYFNRGPIIDTFLRNNHGMNILRRQSGEYDSDRGRQSRIFGYD